MRRVIIGVMLVAASLQSSSRSPAQELDRTTTVIGVDTPSGWIFGSTRTGQANWSTAP